MSLINELKELQWKQLKHDVNYHKDIWLLTVHHRVNHMVLHFAKYNGQLAQASFEKNSDLFRSSCLDTLIIATSLANILNVDLAKAFDVHKSNCTSIDELSISMQKLNDATIDSVSRNVAICVGKLAKAAESIDHLEKFSFRETLNDLVVDIFSIALAGCYIANGRTIVQRIQDRMLSVEQKSMFYEQLGNYKDGYLCS